MRPLATIVGDSLAWYGADEHGGRVHDLLGTGCDGYIASVLSPSSTGNGGYDFHCRSNLARAVLPHGLHEADVHDVLNVFQVTGLDAQGRYFMSPCPAREGDYFEVLAEQDLLMALSMMCSFAMLYLPPFSLFLLLLLSLFIFFLVYFPPRLKISMSLLGNVAFKMICNFIQIISSPDPYQTVRHY